MTTNRSESSRTYTTASPRVANKRLSTVTKCATRYQTEGTAKREPGDSFNKERARKGRRSLLLSCLGDSKKRELHKAVVPLEGGEEVNNDVQ